MEEVKISKKSKVGILPFVAEFEEFAGLAESIFKNAERRGDLDKAYTKLIRGVFVNGKLLNFWLIVFILVSWKLGGRHVYYFSYSKAFFKCSGIKVFLNLKNKQYIKPIHYCQEPLIF